ncbi:MAG: DNA-3-methyladenine glycosylase [Cytophagales bacterium]|nr:DNA-3-methyladenine glycosylase [Bernardetiaceae bacterium]MDW8210042.1 DNA-3-methyladenine glycosylase [Cytophagales bacterium]
MSEDFLRLAAPLPCQFYQRSDVVQIAQELLGKVLVTYIEGQLCAAKIVETEAYCGATDKACHAHMNRRTKRTEIMFAAGGVAYVYLCYGIHSLFNIVTNQEGNADAVLIRAGEPLYNLPAMRQRRGISNLDDFRLTAGPGALAKAMGITTAHYGVSLTDKTAIWIIDFESVSPEYIIKSPRVGVSYAGEDALLPWRFRIKGNKWCSPAK